MGKEDVKTLRASSNGVYVVNRDWLFSFCTESERDLHSIVDLLNATAYWSSPDDLMLMSDAPNRDIWVSKNGNHEFTAVCEVTQEDGVNESRRGKFQCVAGLIDQYYPNSGFDKLKGLRIERSGGDWKYLKNLLEQICIKYGRKSNNLMPEEQQEIGYVSVSNIKVEEDFCYMGCVCDIDEYAKWKTLSFLPVCLFYSKIDNRYKIVIIRPLGKMQDAVWPHIYAAHLSKRLLPWLSTAFKDICTSYVCHIIETGRECRRMVINRAAEEFQQMYKLSDHSWSILAGEHALERAKRVCDGFEVLASNEDDLMAQMDTVKLLATVYFCGYLKHEPEAKDETKAVLMGLALQNKSIDEVLTENNIDDFNQTQYLLQKIYTELTRTLLI